MSRPNFSPKEAGAASAQKSRNPIQAWRAKREKRIRQAQEEAERTITNGNAHNQNVIVDLLGSIDFLHSRLPKAVLETKSNPEQPYCDLEMSVIGIRNKLLRDPQVIKMDIRKFDTNLLILVKWLKQAVEQGDVHAAYTARTAIVRAVCEIRSCIPQIQPEMVEQFVWENAEHLDRWVTLVQMAYNHDHKMEDLYSARAQYQRKAEAYEATRQVIMHQITEDEVLSAVFNELVDHTFGDDYFELSDSQLRVTQYMLSLNKLEKELQYAKASLDVLESEAELRKRRIDLLHLHLIMHLPGQTVETTEDAEFGLQTFEKEMAKLLSENEPLDSDEAE